MNVFRLFDLLIYHFVRLLPAFNKSRILSLLQIFTFITQRKRPRNISFVFISFCLLSTISLVSAKPEFESAKPGYKYSFPKDHSAHPQFASEWWYYTGNLHASGNRDFGYQLTFFRIGIKKDQSIYFAHFALTDLHKKKFHYWDKINQPILQMAGVDDLRIWNKNWEAKIEGKGEKHHLSAQAGDVSLNLTLTTSQPPVIQGKPKEGISRKGSCLSCASHYYSYPNLASVGEVTVAGEKFKVTGKSWMDHEFGSSQLQEKQIGWDWLSLNLNDGSSLMLYQIREQGGKVSQFSNGTYTQQNAQSQYLLLEDFVMKPLKIWHSSKSKANYPLEWEIKVPKAKLGIKLVPKLLNQELITKQTTGVSYWEGAVQAIDLQSGKIIGEGYLELTGYANSLKGKF